jgi:hypothetical protein
MRLLALIPALGALLFGIGQLPPEYLHDLETPPYALPIDTIPPTVYTPPATVPVTATTPVATAPATTTTALARESVAVPPARCGEWWPTARSMGWTDELLETLDRIMWNESRCQADAISPTNDYGLVQVNWATWGSTVTSLGYTKRDLLVPAVNLLIGRLIYQTALDAGWCGWEPWYMSGDYCN